MAETLAMYLHLDNGTPPLEFGTTQAVIDSAKKTVSQLTARNLQLKSVMPPSPCSVCKARVVVGHYVTTGRKVLCMLCGSQQAHTQKKGTIPVQESLMNNGQLRGYMDTLETLESKLGTSDIGQCTLLSLDSQKPTKAKMGFCMGVYENTVDRDDLVSFFGQLPQERLKACVGLPVSSKARVSAAEVVAAGLAEDGSKEFPAYAVVMGCIHRYFHNKWTHYQAVTRAPVKMSARGKLDTASVQRAKNFCEHRLLNDNWRATADDPYGQVEFVAAVASVFGTTDNRTLEASVPPRLTDVNTLRM
eukprot:gene1200-32541_t